MYKLFWIFLNTKLFWILPHIYCFKQNMPQNFTLTKKISKYYKAWNVQNFTTITLFFHLLTHITYSLEYYHTLKLLKLFNLQYALYICRLYYCIPMQYDICTHRLLFDCVKDGLLGLFEIWNYFQTKRIF